MCETKTKKRKKVKATFKKGDRVILDLRDSSVEDFLSDNKPPKELSDIIEVLRGVEFKIKGLETRSGLGDKDLEYYNIQYKSDIIKVTLIGISGYHLIPVVD